MSEQTVVEVNCETGEVTERPMLVKEQKQAEKDARTAAAQRAEEEARPDPVAELLTAVDAAEDLEGVKAALHSGLAAALGRA